MVSSQIFQSGAAVVNMRNGNNYDGDLELEHYFVDTHGTPESVVIEGCVYTCIGTYISEIILYVNPSS